MEGKIMTQHRHLSEEERHTLKRLVDEYGMKTVAEHTGVSTRVIQHAIDAHPHHMSTEQYERIVNYLQARV